MTDLDVFMYSAYVHADLPDKVKAAFLNAALRGTLHMMEIQPEDIKAIVFFKPKTAMQVRWLNKHGFSQKYIQEALGITQAAVSYHIHSKTDYGYMNDFLQNYRLLGKGRSNWWEE